MPGRLARCRSAAGFLAVAVAHRVALPVERAVVVRVVDLVPVRRVAAVPVGQLPAVRVRVRAVALRQAVLHLP